MTFVITGGNTFVSRVDWIDVTAILSYLRNDITIFIFFKHTSILRKFHYAHLDDTI
jgi:hypothetical protein